MDITFACKKCGQSLTIDESAAGQLVDCPKCGTSLEVPFKSNPPPKSAVPSAVKPLAKSDAKRFSPLIVTVVVVLGLFCTGLAILVFVLIRTKSPSSAVSPQYESPQPTPRATTVTTAFDKVLPDITLDGEVFIVTKGGESVKLGLVPVGLLSLADLMPYLKDKEANATNEIARLNPLIKTAEAEDQRLQATYDAEEKRLEEQKARLEAASDAAKHKWYDTVDNKKLEASYEIAFKAMENANEKFEAAQLKAEEHKANVASGGTEKGKLEREQSFFYLSDYYFAGLPSAFRSTKTNGDGKFQMQVPRSGSWALAAISSRHIGDSVEVYYWLFQVDNHTDSPQKVMLSNDNLFSKRLRYPISSWNDLLKQR